MDKRLEDVTVNSPLTTLRSMMDVLRATGKVKDSSKNTNQDQTNPTLSLTQNNITINQQTNNITVPIAIAQRVNAGLDKLSQIDEIHGRLTSNGISSTTPESDK
jgi:hypothetical protein